MKKGVALKNIFLLELILLSLFNFSLNIEENELKDGDIIKVTDENEKHISFTLSDSLKEELKNSYIHFYTSPQKADEINGQQIIYSSTQQNPQLSNAEKYSYKFSKNANLILTVPKENKINLSIKCMKYPCSYDLKVKFEKEYANLNLDDSNNYSNSFSYFVPGNITEKISSMKFMIPSSLNKKYSKGKHLLTISVTNPSDKDAIILYTLYDSKKKELNENTYITPMGKIFSIIEEDIGSNSETKYYLEIESLEYQFISISIKASAYNEYDKIESEIVPNESPKYTFVNNTNNFMIKEECFTINEKYVNEKLKSENNDLLYASIEYFTSPIKEIVSKSNNYKSSSSSVNFILKKEDNKYPQFCLKLNDKEENAYMIQVSHVSNKNENVNIYNPISSGFIHMKTLNKKNLALYTYLSDIHLSKRLSFSLKVLKGKPEMYLYTCEEYPNCINDISKLRSGDKSIVRPELKNNQYYYSFYNENKEKDLSPYGPKQKLLYVYCPEESSDELCQFEILIYSNYDEIVLKDIYKNFNSNLKKDETDLYKIHIPKGKSKIDTVKIILNTNNEDVKIESALEDNKTALLYSKNNREYEFKPVADFKGVIKDFDIPFNVKANKDISYSFDFNFTSSNHTNNTNINNNTDNTDNNNNKNKTNQTTDEGKTKPEPKDNPIEIKNDTKIGFYNINTFTDTKHTIKTIDSLPLLFIFELSKTKGSFNTSHFQDLLFNIYFTITKEMNSSKTSVFDEYEIKSRLISSKLKENDIKSKINEIISNEKAKKAAIDISTKSAILQFEKKYLLEEWNKTENKDSEDTPRLLFLIKRVSENKTIEEKDLSCTFFLIPKNSTSNDSKIMQNIYINDRIHISSKNNLNFYHLSTLNEKDDYFVVDFSANYALSRGIYVTFLNFSNINSVKADDLIINSSNIVFHTKNNSYGKVYHFEFSLKEKKNDIILCVISKVKKSKKGKPLTNLNYIFKYYTTQASEEGKLYKGNKIKFYEGVGQENKDKITQLTISLNMTQNTKLPKYELYVRKVTKDNRLFREEFDSIGIIESKYELINGEINTSQTSKQVIEVKIPKIQNEEDFYSIFINIPELNEKLVYNTINTSHPDHQLWVLILIFSGIPVLLGLIITIIIIAHNKTSDNLREEIMTTSFKESGALGNRKDDEEDRNILT